MVRSSININGYNVYRRDWTSHARGACINDVVLTDSAVEQVGCSIKICNERILMMYLYHRSKRREHNHVRDRTEMREQYRKVSKKQEEIWIKVIEFESNLAKNS